jgi:hypothetical protein
MTASRALMAKPWGMLLTFSSRATRSTAGSVTSSRIRSAEHLFLEEERDVGLLCRSIWAAWGAWFYFETLRCDRSGRQALLQKVER